MAHPKIIGQANHTIKHETKLLEPDWEGSHVGIDPGADRSTVNLTSF